jgi:hypothetical protein
MRAKFTLLVCHPRKKVVDIRVGDQRMDSTSAGMFRPRFWDYAPLPEQTIYYRLSLRAIKTHESRNAGVKLPFWGEKTQNY